MCKTNIAVTSVILRSSRHLCKRGTGPILIQTELDCEFCQLVDIGLTPFTEHHSRRHFHACRSGDCNDWEGLLSRNGQGRLVALQIRCKDKHRLQHKRCKNRTGVENNTPHKVMDTRLLRPLRAVRLLGFTINLLTRTGYWRGMCCI